MSKLSKNEMISILKITVVLCAVVIVMSAIFIAINGRCSNTERIITTTKNVCEPQNVTAQECQCKCLSPKCEEPSFQYCIDKIKEVDNFRRQLK